MPVFKFRALDMTNKIIKGEVKANALDDAQKIIIEKGFTLIKLGEARGIRNFNINLTTSVKVQDVVVFCRELTIIIKSGINLTVGLDILKKQTFKRLKEVIQNITTEVQKGRTLAQAMKEGEQKFPELLIRMISTGEVSGNLSEVLDNMADYYEREIYIRQKIVGAMIYPIILILMSIAMIGFFIIYIIPEFTNMLEGQKMPMITRITLGISSFVISRYMVGIIILFITVFLAIKRVIPEKKYKKVKDTLILKLPIIGEVVKGIITIRFIRTLYLLLKSGLDIVNILEVLKNTISNSVTENTIDFALDGIKRGEKLGDMLTIDGFFDPLIVQMISIGEETGEMENILEDLLKFYEKKVEIKIDKLIAMVEPIFTLAVGSMIALIIISMAYPLFNMVSTMNTSGSGVE